jgi:hypothetical protein
MLGGMALDAATMMSLSAYLLIGLVIGTAHFALLRWNTVLYATGTLGVSIGVQALRMICLGGVLAVIALQGALPLLVATFGTLVARAGVIRWLDRRSG